LIRSTAMPRSVSRLMSVPDHLRPREQRERDPLVVRADVPAVEAAAREDLGLVDDVVARAREQQVDLERGAQQVGADQDVHGARVAAVLLERAVVPRVLDGVHHVPRDIEQEVREALARRVDERDVEPHGAAPVQEAGPGPPDPTAP